jgi:hypothetical protein
MDNVKTFFDVVGYISTVVVVIAFIIGLVMWSRGIIPALLRLGKGLSNRRIAIFATSDHASSLESLLLDSSLFRVKNITHILTSGDVGRAENSTLFLVYWPDWVDNIEQILVKKADDTALIIYAPTGSQRISEENMSKLNKCRNVVVVNFRGRLINDIVVSMITTGY